MLKLSDIIKSGGGNAKINRFVNRYILSKKEKKDIVEAIKEGGNNLQNESDIEYYATTDQQLFDLGEISMLIMWCVALIKYTTKYDNEPTNFYITGYGMMEQHSKNIKDMYGIAYCPMFDDNNGIVLTFKDFCSSLDISDEDFNKAFTKISKEEFYKWN